MLSDDLIRLSSNIKKNFKKQVLDLHSPVFLNKDITEVKKTIKSSFVSTFGKKRELLEKKIKLFTKSKYVLCVNSGTSAMHLGLTMMNIKKDEEILLQSANYISNANCLLYLNATPHFIDIDFNNLSLDIDKLKIYLEEICIIKKKFSINKKTGKIIRALIVTHIFGHTCNLNKLIKILKKYKISLIEDSAESLGSFFNNKHTGTFGRFGILSFNGNKTITTGAGGAILLKNYNDYLKARHYASICKKAHSWEYDYSALGYNYLMPNLNASLGLSQIKRLKIFLKKKIKIMNIYKKIFKGSSLGYIFVRSKSLKKYNSNYWLQTLIISKNFIKEKNFIIKSLIDSGIKVRPLWKPLHKISYLKKFPKMGDLKGTLELYKRAINLPSGQNLL